MLHNKFYAIEPYFTKGGFLSESVIRFSNLQISQKTILNLKFKLPALTDLPVWNGSNVHVVCEVIFILL